MPDSKHGEISIPITTTIDYIDATTFPQISSRTIGPLNGVKFFNLSDAAGYRSGQSSQLSTRSHRIQAKAPPVKIDNFPSPEQYCPKVVLPRAPAYPLSGPKIRDEWMIDTKCTPAPDSYNPHKPQRVMPHYSIGHRSRLGVKPTTPFAIGTFIVKLDETVTVKEARAYLDKHPELGDWIERILDMALCTRPEAPMEVINRYFEAEKAIDDRKKKEMGVGAFLSVSSRDFLD
jgi:hypothetical protein